MRITGYKNPALACLAVLRAGKFKGIDTRSFLRASKWCKCPKRHFKITGLDFQAAIVRLSTMGEFEVWFSMTSKRARVWARKKGSIPRATVCFLP